MNLDEELRTTFASESERLEPPRVDAHDILARGKLRRRRRTTLHAGAAAAVLAVIGIGAFGFTRADWTSTLPAIPPNPTTTAPIARTLPTYDCGAGQCLNAGTYRVGLGIGDDSKSLSGQLQVPWSDWASDGFLHRVWKDSGPGSVVLNVYEPKALAGPQPCDADKSVDLGPDPTANEVAGRLSDLPQFTVAEGPTVVPAFGRETIHLRIQADSLRCEATASGDQYVLAAIHGGDGAGTWEDRLPAVPTGDSTLDPGRPVVIDLWVFDLDGQSIVVEARQEGSPTATTVTQLDQVRQLVRFVSE
jgi:hypothetical protein